MAWLDGRDVVTGSLLTAPSSDGVDVSGWTLLGMASAGGGHQVYLLQEEDYGGVKARTWHPLGAHGVRLFDLMTNEEVGEHRQHGEYGYWSCSHDNSWIECEVLTRGPQHDDRISELRLGRVKYGGHAMGRVWEVQRLQTQGGLAPHTTHHHHVGEHFYSPYTAVYAFWGEEP